MHLFRRPADLLILLTYLLLSAMPFVPLLFGRSVKAPGEILGMELVAWIAVWAVFKRPSRFHWLLLPAFIAMPVELYLQAYYNQGISTHHFGILMETSPKEASEFLGHKIWLLVSLVVAVCLWWGASWKAAFAAHELAWDDRSRWGVIAVLLLGAGNVWYEHAFGVDAAASARSPNTRASAHLPPLPTWARLPINTTTFAVCWPFGLAMHGYEFWKEREYLSALTHKSRLFKFGAQQTGLISNSPQVFLMVIGESSRYDRWSLNGYTRETNPLLQQEANLVSLPNVVSAVSATRLSVPVLVSRKPATQSLQAGFAEKSFLSAFKEAGFKTYWLSNQMSFGQFDTPVSVFAKEADVTQFLNLGGFTNSSSHDDVLLAPLQAAIDDAAPKKLIVLHTLGNHWNYSHRYPKKFDRWRPSLYGIENPVHTDIAIKPQMNNSYDNSILYTDWVLSQVLDTLKSTKQIAAMMYVADHGQTLYDGTCKLAFHGHNTQYEFHVPALVWYSDQYRVAHPSKIHHLLKNRRTRLATENVFHSLLDMADIRYSTEQLEWSLVNRAFKQHKRYVDSYGWTDYDNASMRGDCREVIDRGTPLLQMK